MKHTALSVSNAGVNLHAFSSAHCDDEQVIIVRARQSSARHFQLSPHGAHGATSPAFRFKSGIECLLIIALAMFQITSSAKSFNSGSDGSMGALNVTTDTTLDMPPDGIFKFTTVRLATGATLRFNRNPMNTPVYLLATGDVAINGVVVASGSTGGAGASPIGGAGGPGGFDGGRAGGDGHGPGAGKMGVDGNGLNSAGGGSYATQAPFNDNLQLTNKGKIYGSPLLVPLVGGSGGGGNQSGGGGGGGGAILIASNTRIQFTGYIISSPGGGAAGNNAGSGGAIRLVAPIIAGNGAFRVAGGSGGGDGRIRVDTIDRAGLALVSENNTVPISLGSFMTVFPPDNPRLDIIEVAGTAIAEGSGPPPPINLPFDSAQKNPSPTIVVQARNFKARVPIEVVLTPDIGPSISVKTEINNIAANPAVVTVPVTFPRNTPVSVNAWLR